tara:strand:+ start:1460 stop:1681 length:222 start_codon:yes stop_codon:yes gene_type:complete
VTARDVRDVKGWKTQSDQPIERKKKKKREIAFDFSPQSSIPLKKTRTTTPQYSSRSTPLFVLLFGTEHLDLLH